MNEKCTPADGDPVDMSQFTLGERYGSADMYRDIVPGSKMAVEKDGVLYTDTIQSVSYKSSEWVAPPERSLWERITRRLTPKRLRKPLPQSPPKPAMWTITTGPDDEVARHGRTVEQINDLAASLNTDRGSADGVA